MAGHVVRHLPHHRGVSFNMFVDAVRDLLDRLMLMLLLLRV